MRLAPPAAIAAIAAIAALALAGCGSSASSTSSTPAAASATTTSTTAPATSTITAASGTAPGPETIPLEQGTQLASASSTSPGTKIDGVIECAPVEQLAYHIHVHLQIYVNGQPRSLPAAIGLLGPVFENTPNGRFYGAQKCYYWLHTHASDGVIHVESPTKRIYPLGIFFDEWRQPLTAHQVASASGKVTAFVNGKRWTADPRAIPLKPQFEVQLDVGKPVVPYKSISWQGSGL
jgi:hypothetical protein